MEHFSPWPIKCRNDLFKRHFLEVTDPDKVCYFRKRSHVTTINILSVITYCIMLQLESDREQKDFESTMHSSEIIENSPRSVYNLPWQFYKLSLVVLATNARCYFNTLLGTLFFPVVYISSYGNILFHIILYNFEAEFIIYFW